MLMQILFVLSTSVNCIAPRSLLNMTGCHSDTALLQAHPHRSYCQDCLQARPIGVRLMRHASSTSKATHSAIRLAPQLGQNRVFYNTIWTEYWPKDNTVEDIEKLFLAIFIRLGSLIIKQVCCWLCAYYLAAAILNCNQETIVRAWRIFNDVDTS